MKKCNTCGLDKDDYGKDSRNYDGLQGICNLCKQRANKILRESRAISKDYKRVEEKKCSVCPNVKKIEDFFRDKAMPDGHSTICKECKTKKTYAWRAANKDRYNKSQRDFQKKACPEKRYGVEIKRRYGCTLEEYNQRLVNQGGKCSICAKLHNPAEKKGRLFVDHCHKTGKVRDLICGACNSGLGYFLDDTRVMSEAIAYIIRHRE